MADKPANDNKKAPTTARIKQFAPIILLIAVLGATLSFCTSSDEQKKPASEVQAPVQESQVRKDLSIIFPRLRRGSAEPAPAQAKPIALNTVCAPFSTTMQLCEIPATDEGSGWIALENGTRAGLAMCYRPSYEPAKTVAERTFKEVWVMLDNGEIRKIEPEDLDASLPLQAMKFVPNTKVMFTYYLGEGSCLQSPSKKSA